MQSSSTVSFYDTLSVTRDAPSEVIRAAYRSLTQLHHPDRHPDDTAAAARMAAINRAYEVLSDRTRRRLHDAALQRDTDLRSNAALHADARGNAAAEAHAWQLHSAKTRLPAHQARFDGNFLRQLWQRLGRHRWGGAAALVLLVSVIAAWLFWPGAEPPETYGGPLVLLSSRGLAAAAAADAENVSPAGGASRSPASAPAYQRPLTDPYGHDWPTRAVALDGYDPLATDHEATILVDNRQGSADMLVRIVETVGQRRYPRRTLFVPAHGDFTVTGLLPGKYDVRYQDLGTGRFLKSGLFTLTDPDPSGRRPRAVVRIALAAGAVSGAACQLDPEEF